MKLMQLTIDVLVYPESRLYHDNHVINVIKPSIEYISSLVLHLRVNSSKNAHLYLLRVSLTKPRNKLQYIIFRIVSGR